MTQLWWLGSQKTKSCRLLGLIMMMQFFIGCILAQEKAAGRAPTQPPSGCNIKDGGWTSCPVPLRTAVIQKEQSNDTEVAKVEDENEEEPSPEDEYGGQITFNFTIPKITLILESVTPISTPQEEKSEECSVLLSTMDKTCRLDNLTQLGDMSFEQTGTCCELLSQLQEGQCEDFCQLPPKYKNLQLWSTVCRVNLCQQDPDTEKDPVAINTNTTDIKNNTSLQNFMDSILGNQQVPQNEGDTLPEILPAPQKDVCVFQKHSNADGVPLEETSAEDEGECCQKCQDISGCNTFVYCPKKDGCRSVYSNPIQIFDHKMCHLKQQVSINLGANPVYYYRGVETDFVSGFIFGRTQTPAPVPPPAANKSQLEVSSACASYVTDGPNRVAVSEGDNMQAPSGNQFLNVDDAKECVTACESLIKSCGKICCDSVSYNPQYKQCWLKHGGSSEQTRIHEDGWQTFWRNDQDNQKYQAIITAFEICDDDVKGGEYTDAYVTYGVGQLAVSEGSIIPMADGLYSKKLTLKECAQECQQLLECDAMTYSVRKLTCFLRSGSRKFDTISNEEGWTTYWRIPSYSSPALCGTQKGWYCLYCGGTYGDSCEYF